MVTVVIILNLLTASFAFMEAWGFTRQGSDGMQLLLGRKLDHLAFVIQRGLLLLFGGALVLFVHSVPAYAICAASWVLMFPFIHQLSYNTTMSYLHMSQYNVGLGESKTTTARKTSIWYKVLTFCLGFWLAVFSTFILKTIVRYGESINSLF